MNRTLLLAALALAVLPAPIPASAQTTPRDTLNVTPDKHLQVLSASGAVVYDVPLAGSVPLVDTPEGRAAVIIQTDGTIGLVPYAAAMAALFAQVPPSPAPSTNAASR